MTAKPKLIKLYDDENNIKGYQLGDYYLMKHYYINNYYEWIINKNGQTFYYSHEISKLINNGDVIICHSFKQGKEKLYKLNEKENKKMLNLETLFAENRAKLEPLSKDFVGDFTYNTFEADELICNLFIEYAENKTSTNVYDMLGWFCKKENYDFTMLVWSEYEQGEDMDDIIRNGRKYKHIEELNEESADIIKCICYKLLLNANFKEINEDIYNLIESIADNVEQSKEDIEGELMSYVLTKGL